MDVFLCEEFNKLNIGDKYRYGIYEAVVISNSHIEQKNLNTGTKRDIKTTTSASNTKSKSCNPNANPNSSQWQFNMNPSTSNIKSKSKSKSNNNRNPNINQRNMYSSNLTSTTNTNCNINYTNMSNTSDCKCNMEVDNSHNSKTSSDKATQTLNKKETGYSKLTKLSKEEIETMFFGVNGVDPNYYRITSIDEIDESQLKISEGIYNSLINHVRISQTQENNGKKPKETEKWLWHGTNVQVIDKIEVNGFDRNYNTMSAYGTVKFFS